METKKLNNKPNKRNIGIDLLKLIFTFMICVLHTLGRNGLLLEESNSSINYSMAWFVEMLCYCAVDGYIVIHGYNSTKKDINDFSRLIELWFQVFFYSFILTSILYIFGIRDSITIKFLFKSFFPVSFEIYWYFSAFAVLCIFEPYINIVLNKLDQNKSKILLSLIVIIFMFSGMLNDAYQLEGGYSVIWFVVLYSVGYLCKRVGFLSKTNNIVLLLVYIFSSSIGWFFMIFFKINKLVSYSSPFVVLSAICLVILFSNISIKKCRNIILYLSSFTFDIYLFQSNYSIYLLTLDRISFIKKSQTLHMLIAVVSFAFLLFIGGLVLGVIRKWLFSLINVKKLSTRVNNSINNIIEKY